MEEKEENGISIGDIFRTIFSQKWLALIIAFVITIAGTIGLYLMGKSSRVYSVTFVMTLPDSDLSPVDYDYPDGTPFNYVDIVSTESLETVKASSQDYENVDIEKMVQNGDISIIRVLEETAEGSKEYAANYKLTVKASYFGSEDIARSFMVGLTQIPGNYLKQMNINYDAYLTAASEALTYDTQLSYLQNQTNYIVGLYERFINSYNGSFVVENGKTLTAYRSEIDVFLSNGVFDRLKTEARDKHYIKSSDALSKYESELSDKERQLVREKAALENLLNIKTENDNTDNKNTSIVVDAAQIVAQTNTVERLKQDIQDLKDYRDKGTVSETFNASVKELETKISKFTEDYAGVAAVVYSTATSVSFADTNIVKAEGGRGLVMS